MESIKAQGVATMAFARAFSQKREKPEAVENIFVGRAATQRGGRPVVRTQISSPTALLSTSNAGVYTAQRIAGTRPIEIRKVSDSSMDSCSSDESDASSCSEHSSGTITDASSIAESTLCASPESINSTSYLKFPDENRGSSPLTIDWTDPDLTPRLPQRATSHSKAAHESLHRKRSIQRMATAPAVVGNINNNMPYPISNGAIRKSENGRTSKKDLLPPLSFSKFDNGTRNSFDIVTQYQLQESPKERISSTSTIESPQRSPFDAELNQLQEVVESFGNATRTPEEDADVMVMERQGLASFSAADYMFEIQSLIHVMFADEQPVFKALGSFF